MKKLASPKTARRIEDPNQIRCLEVPVRQEILDAIRVLQPCSALEVARHLGRRHTALYHHLQQLLAHDLIEEYGLRSTARRPEMLYHVPHNMRLRYDLTDPENIASVARVADGIARTASKDFHAGLLHDRAVAEGPGRNVWAARTKLWLSAQDLAEVNGLLDRITQLMEQKENETRQLYAISWVVSPCSD